MLERTDEGWRLSGFAAFVEHGATGLRYKLDLAPDFLTRTAQINGFRDDRPFDFRFRKDRCWYLNDRAVGGLDDLIHLDFGFTPATNFQQLRHANLRVGESADIPAAWFDIGENGLVRLPQHYRRLSEDRYHYSSPTASYEAELQLSPNGFVRSYPGLWVMDGDQ